MYKRRAANQKRRIVKNKLEDDHHSEVKQDERNDKPASCKVDETVKNEDKSSEFPRENIVPKHCTPKRNTTSSRNESPVTPLSSPVLHTMFPRTFHSPDIEVTWDWGCSQVSSDMLPPKRSKRPSKVETSPFFPQPINTIYTRRPIQKPLTEEENQKRLEFYKSILLPTNKDKHPDDSTGSQNTNMEKENSEEDLHITTTPKHSTSCSNDRVKIGEESNYFDDSANEFMLECSQAIEEQLKNGEIEEGSVVNIKLATKETEYSLAVNRINSHKDACNEKLKSNLFPEKPGGKRRLSLKSPINKRLKSDLNKTPLKSNQRNNKLRLGDENICLSSSKAEQLTSNTGCVNNNDMYASCNNNNNKIGHAMINLTSNPIDELNQRSVPNTCGVSIANISNRNHHVAIPVQSYSNVPKISNSGVNVNSRYLTTLHGQNNSSTLRQNIQNNNTFNNNTTSIPTTLFNPSINKTSEKSTNRFKDSKLDTTDLNSLLDDDLDAELSRLDFDSICSMTKRQDQETAFVDSMVHPTQPIVRPAPQICSHKEIEAKRLAALNKLMMKRKKR